MKKSTFSQSAKIAGLTFQSIGIIAESAIAIHLHNIPLGFVCIFFAIAMFYFIKMTSKVINSVSINEQNVTNQLPLIENFSVLEQQLQSSIKNKLQVIPVLTEQLKEVIDQTDEAAGSLIEGFMGINKQAKEQLQAVQGLFGNLTTQSADSNILFQTQENLREIQTNFETLTSFFDKSIKIIEEVMDQLNKVDTFAMNIHKISKTTNILALNASIEASRHGDAGKGFQVIASEVNHLSKDSNTSIKEITEITEKLSSKISAIKTELENVHQHSSSIGTRTNELFNQTINKIEETLNDTAGKIKTVAGDAEILSKGISKIVVSIQFQDITRQRIEHVITPLLTLNNDISGALDTLTKSERSAGNNMDTDYKDNLAKQYTMESERKILQKVLNQNS